MESKLVGKFALVTGGGSGIGRALSIALAKKGVCVTVVDCSETDGKEAVRLVEKEHAKLSTSLKCPGAIFVKCDVASPADLVFAFTTHANTYRRLDICINSAGMIDAGTFIDDGRAQWRRVIDVNLSGLIDSTRLAIDSMKAEGHGGAILNVGSAAGLYPLPNAPIYSASKGGVVLFSRALKWYKHRGIRVNVLCPEFVDTNIGKQSPSKLTYMSGGFIPMDMVIKGAFELIEDETKAGECLWITNRHGIQCWPSPEEKKRYTISFASQSKANLSDSHADIPTMFGIPEEFEKVVVHTLDSNFRKATRIERVHFRQTVRTGHVLVKNIYAGVNASDVNYSSGRYFGSEREAKARLPLDSGFEAVGVIVALGESVDGLKVNIPVAIMSFGAYAEFSEVLAKHCLPVPGTDPEIVAMLTSGLTASIALEQGGMMKSGQSILVTAAAGGTGQFAVQLAKLAGNKVIATCGGTEKAELLKELGVDRVINYQKEDVKLVLKREFQKGIDIIYESVGGDMFMTCLNALAIGGRIIVIGMISQYQGEGGWKPAQYTGLCEKLLFKSQTLAGFFLNHYTKFWREHLRRLYDLHAAGKLKVMLDPKQFLGLETVADAVEYLHSGRSVGKVVVCIDPKYRKQNARL